VSPRSEKPFFPHGEALRHLRKEARKTQQEVWADTGVHYTEISCLERGIGNPTYGTIESLATGLGVSVSRIFSLSETYAEMRKKQDE
jgi:transcriptional regulator with XRE-family HTH domain